MGYGLYDMHLHLDGFDDPEAVATALDGLGVACLAATVTPRRYELSSELADRPNVRLAVGMHPWYFEDELFEGMVEKAVSNAYRTRFIGEIGLDFYERHAPESTWARQRYALERILSACAEASDAASPHLLSLHSVRSAGEVLDLLEKTGAAESCSCIFHWFSGSTDELWRAIRMGCWFSAGPFMMQVKRSREYAKLIPGERLLLETDYPPGDRWQESDAWAQEVKDKLLEAAGALAGPRKCSPDDIVAQTSENAAGLLGI